MKGFIAMLVMVSMAISGSLGMTLFEAVATNNVTEVRRIVEYKGKHQGYFYTDSSLALYSECYDIAVARRYLEVLKLLIGCPSKFWDSSFPSQLYSRLTRTPSDYEMIRVLISSGYEPTYDQYLDDIRKKRMDLLRIYMEYDMIPHSGLITKAGRMGDSEVLKLLLRPPIRKMYFKEELSDGKWWLPWDSNYKLNRELFEGYMRNWDPPYRYPVLNDPLLNQPIGPVM